jgi:hypothetical protein
MCRDAALLDNGAGAGQSVVIRLELQVAGQSLTGRASDATGVEREFSGWIGMVAAVDALLSRPAPAAADQHPIRAAEEENG